MSNTWFRVCEASMIGEVGQLKSQFFVALLKANPQLAQLLSKVNWTELAIGVAKETLKKMASAKGWNYSESEFSASRIDVKGKTIAYVQSGQYVLGFSRGTDGQIHEFVRTYDDHRHVTEGWQKEFARGYREAMVEKMFAMFGFAMKKSKNAQGKTVITAVKAKA